MAQRVEVVERDLSNVTERLGEAVQGIKDLSELVKALLMAQTAGNVSGSTKKQHSHTVFVPPPFSPFPVQPSTVSVTTQKLQSIEEDETPIFTFNGAPIPPPLVKVPSKIKLEVGQPLIVITDDLKTKENTDFAAMEVEVKDVTVMAEVAVPIIKTELDEQQVDDVSWDFYSKRGNDYEREFGWGIFDDEGPQITEKRIVEEDDEQQVDSTSVQVKYQEMVSTQVAEPPSKLVGFGTAEEEDPVWSDFVVRKEREKMMGAVLPCNIIDSIKLFEIKEKFDEDLLGDEFFLKFGSNFFKTGRVDVYSVLNSGPHW